MMIVNREIFVIAENQEDAFASLRKIQLLGLSIFPDREAAQEALSHYQTTTATPLHIFPMLIVVTAEPINTATPS